MPRLIACLSFSFTVSYYGLWLTDGVITPFYAEILSAFPTVATIFGALSFALYSYLDGIAKDLPPSQEGRDHRKYVEAVDAIGSLRREVIVNIFLVITLLIAERGASGFTAFAEQQQWSIPSALEWTIFSIRFSCLLTSLTAAAIQLRGFLTANRLRDVIAKQRKPKRA